MADPTSTPTISDRFRSAYRELSPEEKDLLTQIKTKASELEALIAQGVKLEAGRYSSLAYTALEQAVFWAVKGVTS